MIIIEPNSDIDYYVYIMLRDGLINDCTILFSSEEGVCFLANNGVIYYVPKFMQLDLFTMKRIKD